MHLLEGKPNLRRGEMLGTVGPTGHVTQAQPRDLVNTTRRKRKEQSMEYLEEKNFSPSTTVHLPQAFSRSRASLVPIPLFFHLNCLLSLRPPSPPRLCTPNCIPILSVHWLYQVMEGKVVNNLVSEAPILSNESCAIVIAEIRRLFKRSDERMDSLMRRLDESGAAADKDLGVLGSKRLPMDATPDGRHVMDYTTATVAVVMPDELNITTVAMDDAMGDATAGTSSALLLPSAASTSTKEHIPKTDFAAAVSNDVPNKVDDDTSSKCSKECLPTSIDNMASVHAALASSSPYVLPGVTTLSLAVWRFQLPENIVLVAHQVLVGSSQYLLEQLCWLR